jgi:O-antigen/teichoic acid export membrane protein
VLSGLSNFLTVALVARSAAPEDFGRFAVVYALFLGGLAVARTLWGTRLAMTSSPDETLRQLRGLLGVTLYAAPAGIGVMLIASLAVTGRQGLPVATVLALALPLVIGQDLCRYAAVAAARPAVAVGSDLVWVVAVVAGYFVRPPMLIGLGIWALGAVLALAIALLALRLTPSLRAAGAALTERHHTSEVSALVTVVSSLESYATLGLAMWAIGASAAGAIRGASTVMAPVSACFSFVGLALLPVVYRAPAQHHMRLVGKISVFLVILTLAWGSLMLVLPSGIGRLLLGESWSPARAVFPWMTLYYVGSALYTAVMLGFQARKAARLLAGAALVGAVLMVVAAVIAAGSTRSTTGFTAWLASMSVLIGVGTSVWYYWRAKRPATTAGSAAAG